MSTTKEIQNEIVEEFSFFENWEDKYQYLIDLGKEMDAFPESLKIEENIVNGCQSKVWLHPELEGGLLKFYGDSDAIIVKGLIALLLRVYSGQKPQDIMDSEPDFVEKIGLGTHLSPTRSNGLASMVSKIKMYALALSRQA